VPTPIHRLFRPRALPAEFDFELAGGLRARVRPIRPMDSVRFERGYPKLSEASRRARFFGQASALSQTQLHFLTAVDQVRHVAWGALNADDLDDPGIGIARYIAMSPTSTTAEVALTILDAYQHRGAGSLLHACLHLTAARHGFRTFVYDVSQDNVRFLRNLKAIGANQIDVAEHIVRLEMPVYRRPAQLPKTADGLRFVEIMKRLARVRPLAASA
jgi:hypothetical protein